MMTRKDMKLLADLLLKMQVYNVTLLNRGMRVAEHGKPPLRPHHKKKLIPKKRPSSKTIKPTN